MTEDLKKMAEAIDGAHECRNYGSSNMVGSDQPQGEPKMSRGKLIQKLDEAAAGGVQFATVSVGSGYFEGLEDFAPLPPA